MFAAPVFLRTVPDAAAIGAALRAKHGYLCSSFAARSPGSTPLQQQQSQTNSFPAVESAPLVEEVRRGAGAYVPFSRVLPGAATAGTAAAAPDDGGVHGVVRLAASPRADADVVYEGMVER